MIDAGVPCREERQLTRKRRWERLDEPIEYTATQLDRDVVARIR